MPSALWCHAWDLQWNTGAYHISWPLCLFVISWWCWIRLWLLKQIKMNFNYHHFTKFIVIVFAPPCPPPFPSNLRIWLKHRCEWESDIYAALSPAHASALQRMFQRFSAYFSAINMQCLVRWIGTNIKVTGHKTWWYEGWTSWFF